MNGSHCPAWFHGEQFNSEMLWQDRLSRLDGCIKDAAESFKTRSRRGYQALPIFGPFVPIDYRPVEPAAVSDACRCGEPVREPGEMCRACRYEVEEDRYEEQRR